MGHRFRYRPAITMSNSRASRLFVSTCACARTGTPASMFVTYDNALAVAVILQSKGAINSKESDRDGSLLQ